MRVKMLTVECGPAGNFHAGDEREVSDEHGRQLLAGGHAVQIVPRRPEAAVVVPGERAVMPAPVKRKRAR